LERGVGDATVARRGPVRALVSRSFQSVDFFERVLEERLCPLDVSVKNLGILGAPGRAAIEGEPR